MDSSSRGEDAQASVHSLLVFNDKQVAPASAAGHLLHLSFHFVNPHLPRLNPLKPYISHQ